MMSPTDRLLTEHCWTLIKSAVVMDMPTISSKAMRVCGSTKHVLNVYENSRENIIVLLIYTIIPQALPIATKGKYFKITKTHPSRREVDLAT